MSDIILQEGQRLTEHWHVEFIGKDRARRDVGKWIECRMMKMYHNTIYAGSVGHGKTVEEARLNMVLAVARAISEDVTAFQHDADELYKAQTLRWWDSKIKEQREELELLEDDAEESPRSKHRQERRKIQREIKLLERLVAEWQDDHDYWPDADDR